MQEKKGRKTTRGSSRPLWAGLLAAAAVTLAAIAWAQDFRGFRSTAERMGLPTLAPSTPGGTPETDSNNPGRGFLRWWDPVRATELTVDNDRTIPPGGGLPGGAATSTGAWIDPAAPASGYTIFAFNFTTTSGLATPYRMIRNTAQTLATNDPAAGATATYTWTFSNLNPGQAYTLSVNLPIGPTMTSPPGFKPSDFPQKFNVYRVSGDVDGDFTEIVDVLSDGGGLYRLGGESRVFIPTGTTLTIQLFNTSPRNSDGLLLDPDSVPGSEWVYADSALIQTTDDNPGSISAQPIVAELNGSTAPGAGSSRVRVVSARNEPFRNGSIQQTLQVGMVSSFRYNGDPAAGGDQNREWMWPAPRPTSAAGLPTFNSALEAWTGARATHRVQQDNTAFGFNNSGVGFTAQTGPDVAGFIGPNFLQADGGAAVTGTVVWNSNLPETPTDGTNGWFVEVFIPQATGSRNFSGQVTYRIQAWDGRTYSFDNAQLSQAANQGRWVRLPNQPADGYFNSATLPIRVSLTNVVGDAAAAPIVVADAVRFVRGADLSITSTPVAATTDFLGNSRDVVVVAAENGTIYALDGVGDSTNRTTSVLWQYPAANPATDPNNNPAEDGGVAEMPTGFGPSSALIQNVGGEDLLFIAAENGRVYCLEMDGDI
ncbi:MAG: hypothetical protein MH204_04705, partial [Fimbriimonadaceae bacterium]|nr:hypothetical protein [Fimbriimonadaceae bacterium]